MRVSMKKTIFQDHFTSQVVRILLKWSGDSPVNTDSLTTDVDGFIDQYHDVALKDLDIAAFITDLTTLLQAPRLANSSKRCRSLGNSVSNSTIPEKLCQPCFNKASGV
jgi:hypothetical protein